MDTVKLNATAKDAKGYLVKGAKVSFKIITYPSLGTLSRVVHQPMNKVLQRLNTQLDHQQRSQMR